MNQRTYLQAMCLTRQALLKLYKYTVFKICDVFPYAVINYAVIHAGYSICSLSALLARYSHSYLRPSTLLSLKMNKVKNKEHKQINQDYYTTKQKHT